MGDVILGLIGVSIIAAAGLTFSREVGGVLRRSLRLIGVRAHVWRYRNPHARTCTRCGLSEVRYDYGNHTEWEVVLPLARSPGACWGSQNKRWREKADD